MDLLLALSGLPVLELSAPEFADEELVQSLNQFRKLYMILPAKTSSLEEVQKNFHPFLMMWMNNHPGWNLESYGKDLFGWQSDKVCYGDKRLLKLEELQEWLTLVEGAALASKHSPSTKAKLLIDENNPKPISEILLQAMGRGVYGAFGLSAVAI